MLSRCHGYRGSSAANRSEEHTSELQSQSNLVCRLLLEKKKKIGYNYNLVKYTKTHHRSEAELRLYDRAHHDRLALHGSTTTHTRQVSATIDSDVFSAL